MTPTMIFVLIVVAIAAARLTRLVVFDVYPPMQWLRDRFDDATGDSLWNKLMHCHYCASPYCTAIIWAPVFALNRFAFGWGFAIVVGFALSYIAAIIVALDGDQD